MCAGISLSGQRDGYFAVSEKRWKSCKSTYWRTSFLGIFHVDRYFDLGKISLPRRLVKPCGHQQNNASRRRDVLLKR